ncbi:hypothetical protein HS088_TW07G01152 [Tripterygium wilfordii]|uniref:Exportin-T n=1 Tax=Tripterygium wilfordii TaxID=458696 RepID=A0A7J7DGQ7_TRIWF|nr:hypothetical protein HS088_TW07G01152 [Tripterygium wilfordii]
MGDETMRTRGGLLGELVVMLLSTSFSCHPKGVVALMYLEIITRYMKFAQEDNQYIPMVLAAFLDKRGIRHPNIHVSRRACYLFMRVVKVLKAKLVPFVETIVQNLKDTTARFTNLDYTLKELSGSEDGSHIFEPREMVSFLVLLNQLICKFRKLFHDILEEVYPTIVGRIFSIIPRDTFPSGPGTNTEEIRELQELQRILYTFLHVIATHDLSSIFLSPKSRGYLDPMLQLLLCSACDHKDILVRKASVQIFNRLMKDWCVKPHDEDKVPGFRSFMIEAFAINCCLYSVLDKSFEFRDANALALFGEIVMAQKVMFEKFGDDFLAHFVSKGFPTAHCPQDLVELYCQKLQGSDIKALRSFYQSLIENLRLQPNGSVVFRWQCRHR